MSYKPQLDKVSATDTTPDFLINKLVAGGGVTITQNGAGGDETLTITGAAVVECKIDDVSIPPTQEEITNAFGSPNSVGQGFLGLLDDAGLGVRQYLCLSDGSKWLYAPFSVAASSWATASLTRRGTVLEAIDGENGNIYEPTVIYEGSPQILTDLTNVYKMWFTAGWGTLNISYAESPDGVTWTRYSGNPVIENRARSTVVKNGSTYYLYAANSTDSVISLYTSSDGLTWTYIKDCIATAGGTWKSANVANSFAWIEGTDWYMLYDGYNGSGGWKEGLATSANGEDWTDYGSNPVISETGTVGGVTVYKHDSTYYLLAIHSSSGVLPTDIYRYHSTDLHTWTSDGAFIARSGADEGEGTSVGQTADPSILIRNGVLYVFYAGSSDGTQGSGAQHIKLITGKEGLLWE